jgi:hypothetical protein
MEIEKLVWIGFISFNKVNLIFLNYLLVSVLVYRQTGITNQFASFDGFQLLPTDRFLGFGIGLLVIPTDLLIIDFLNLKFKFGTIFN